MAANNELDSSFKNKNKNSSSDGLAKKPSFNNDNSVLKIENMPKEMDYVSALDTLAAFGTVIRIKKLWKCSNKSSTFYFTFSTSESANLAHSKMNNMIILGNKLVTSVHNKKNVEDDEDDYVPESESEIPTSPKDEIEPIYNLVITEEGHSPLKVFDHLNKRIGRPNLSSEHFTKFSRNSYLIKVARIDQGYSLQGEKNFKNSGIIKIVPYDDYNGSKGKIYNSDLAKLDRQEFLDCCPPNVIDAFNIKVYDPTLKQRVNSPLIILRFSNNIAPIPLP